MKKVTQTIRFLLVTILLAGLIATFNTALAEASKERNADYKTVITNLENLIDSSPNLKDEIEKVLRLQDNRSYYWNNKVLKYFVIFLKNGLFIIHRHGQVHNIFSPLMNWRIQKAVRSFLITMCSVPGLLISWMPVVSI